MAVQDEVEDPRPGEERMGRADLGTPAIQPNMARLTVGESVSHDL